ncbi:MAG TPA: hypothetical protein VND65_21990 [Candidatus Binatia bacterium]|nr:hypothetical protein [Candidatus Binatia bacterium]
MHRRWPVNPRRFAYVHNSFTSGAAQNCFNSFYNDSNHLYLAVYEWGNDPIATGTVEGWVLARAKLGSTPVFGSPVVGGDGQPPGQMLVGQVGLNPTLGFTQVGEGGQTGWVRNFPFAVLPPGWSLTAYSSAQNVQLAVTVWYEWIYPDDLYSQKIGDPERDYEA